MSHKNENFTQIKTRKYRCFCCAVEFSTIEEMKHHILDKHEEGRDYVLCPFSHCQFPVRDIKSHVKTKHPHLPMPKIGMNSAIVWREFSANGDKKPRVKKPKYREGWYQSYKMNKPLHYRSGYESTFYECLDADLDVTAFDVEPFEISYIHKGKAHKYIPDIIVHFLSGKIQVIEIKPSTQTSLPKNQDKWVAAEAACKTRGWEFLVLTETGINNWKNKIKQQKIDWS